MKIKLLVAAAATVVASSAMAQSAFEGAYGQLGIGFDQNSISSSSFLADGTSVSTPSANGGSFSGVVGLGYNFAVSKEFLLGLGADFGFVPSNTFNGTNSNGTFQTKISNRYNIFITPGYVIEKDKLAYLKAGYSSQSVKITDQSNVGSNGQTMGSGSANGYVLGLGYKQMVSSGLYGFGEVNYYSYSGASFASQSITDDIGTYTVSGFSPKTSAYQFLVGVGYKF